MKSRYGFGIIILIGLLMLGIVFRHKIRPVLSLVRAYRYVSYLEQKGGLQKGDIVFHQSRSSQSKAIATATHSPLTHCGILDYHQGQWQVLEAVEPVRYTPLWRWVARGAPGSFCLARMAKPLSQEQQRQILTQARGFLGKHYDLAFGWSDERIYCSELVYKAYQRGVGKRLGVLTQLGRFDLSHPAVQAKLQERYGSHIPLQEPVISPEAIYQSPALQILQSNE